MRLSDETINLLVLAVQQALSVEDSVTQGQERERRVGYVPALRAALEAVKSETAGSK